ncbi:MAG: alkaline phosphatase family protein [Magnetococcales bacterium]|nr:alkaline phosphatase family protein [Magnetococcales bacterium]
MTNVARDLPVVLAGPVLRRTTADRISFWLAVTTPVRVRLILKHAEQECSLILDAGSTGYRCITAGRYLHLLLLDWALDEPLPMDCWIGYRLSVQQQDDDAVWQEWQEWAPDLAYAHWDTPGFLLPSRVGAVVHGSCRKPHHDSGDGLVEADRLLAGERDGVAWPSMLVLSGDQIYSDDVAGPMLRAIHLLMERLQLADENLADLGLEGMVSGTDLLQHPDGYYRRDRLLPKTNATRSLIDLFFGGIAKPIFTSDSAGNHLITIAEYLCMYLLVWSPTPWTLFELTPPAALNEQGQRLFAQEQPLIEAFVRDLAAVRRVMAHLPVAMIFDDHEISDDWNLHRAWEENVYGHPFSRRMVGNGLMAYLLCQGWGNRPEAFSADLLEEVAAVLASPGRQDHQRLIDRLLKFQQWDFDWPTHPPLIVLDTRTRRWRSESSPTRPSGLIDWEAITDLQQRLYGQSSVMLVSASPIFGVKLIEVIQRIVAWLGKPLLVDAENWMAHPGTASGILNVFRHPKTPHNFIVLSGDVHYSFVYDVELRGQVGGPHIWQICSSGIRNEFPQRLLAWLDHLNRWLYSPRSPLNGLTRRRRMRIIPRKPVGTPAGRRLLNQSGIGLVELDVEGRPWRIRHLVANGPDVSFERREAEAHWD